MQVNTDMNRNNENFTPRERVDANLLARLLQENEPPTAIPTAARLQPQNCPCRTEETEKMPRPSCPLPTQKENCPARGRSLAMLYSPRQSFEELYDAEQGLARGTIFRQLDLPLTTGKCQQGRWNA